MATGVGFTMKGIPVTIQPVFFVVIVFLGILAPSPVYTLTFVVIATISILLHEFGHAVAFRHFGLVPRITLHAMGGLTSATPGGSGAPFTPARSIITSLAGPLSALVILGLPALWYAQRLGFDPWLYLSPYRTTLRRSPEELIAAQIVYINVGWSLLNLVPVLPLDGGNVTASVCELIVPKHGRRIANGLSIVFAVAFAIVGYPYLGVVAPIFAVMFIGMNINDFTKSRSEGVDEQLSEALRALLQYDPVRADQITRSVLVGNPTRDQQGWAIELAAWARLAVGDAWGAQHLLVSMPPGSAPSASIRGALSLAMGNMPEGVSVVAWALAHDQARQAKALGVMAAAQGGQVVPIVNELLAMGPDGHQAAVLFASLLDYTGHRREAEQVLQMVAVPAPRPPGW